MKKKCLTRECIESSSHPELEPPCTLVYAFLTEKERKQYILRAKAHTKLHLDKAIKDESYQ